jgi:hypothetical protein
LKLFLKFRIGRFSPPVARATVNDLALATSSDDEEEATEEGAEEESEDGGEVVVGVDVAFFSEEPVGRVVPEV